jgi:hypothetical protein
MFYKPLIRVFRSCYTVNGGIFVMIVVMLYWCFCVVGLVLRGRNEGVRR